MIEILAIIVLTVLIGRQAKRKGLKKWPYQLMAVILWFCGEFIGALLAAIIGRYILSETLPILTIYLAAVGGAVAGAILAFLILRWIPDSDIRVVPSESDGQPFQPVNNPPFERSAWLPALAGITAASCLCLLLGGLMIAGIASALDISASEPILSYSSGRNNELSGVTNVIPSNAKNLFISYFLEIPADQEAVITYLIIYESSPLVSFTESHERGQVLTIIFPSLMGKIKFPEGDYVIEIKYGNTTLSYAAFHVGEIDTPPLTSSYFSLFPI